MGEVFAAAFAGALQAIQTVNGAGLLPGGASGHPGGADEPRLSPPGAEAETAAGEAASSALPLLRRVPYPLTRNFP